MMSCIPHPVPSLQIPEVVPESCLPKLFSCFPLNDPNLSPIAAGHRAWRCPSCSGTIRREMLLERETMPPLTPLGSRTPGLGPRCASVRSKLSLGPFYLGTNPLGFPAWPCAPPCKRTKGSFHQLAAAGKPSLGGTAVTRSPENISEGQRGTCVSTCAWRGCPHACA